jgi:L-arabinokinase
MRRRSAAPRGARRHPSVVVSNFTWDWIYEARYSEGYEGHEASRVIQTIRSAYARADAAWRLPMHGGFARSRTIVDVPFVARHATQRRKRRGGASACRPTAARAADVGGYGVNGLDVDALDLGDAGTSRGGRPGHLRRRPALRGSGPRRRRGDHQAGYGTLSECIANDTAVVYTSRGRFAEYDVLVREMPKYLRCAYLTTSRCSPAAGSAALDAALAAPSRRSAAHRRRGHHCGYDLRARGAARRHVDGAPAGDRDAIA